MAEALTYNLIVLESGNATDTHEGRGQALKPDEVAELIMSGRAVLDSNQTTPPKDLLDFVAAQMVKSDFLGPPLELTATRSMIESHVFRDNLRQKSVEGRVLHWAHGYMNALRMVATCRLRGQTNDLSIYDQLREVLFAYLQRCPSVYRPQAPDFIEAFKEGLVPETPKTEPLDSIEIPGNFHVLPRNWYMFYRAFVSLSLDLEVNLANALESGRVIVSQDSSKGDRFVPPELLDDDPRRLRRDYHFLATKDLPKKWFREGSLDKRKSDAKKWANRLLAHVHEQGRRASRDDIQAAMERKFDLKPNASLNVWRACNNPNAEKSGRISVEERFYFNEIMAFD